MLSRRLECSFCGRKESEVEKLVSGPDVLLRLQVYICDRCVAEASRIMEGNDPPSSAGKTIAALVRRFLWKTRRLWRLTSLRLGGGWAKRGAPAPARVPAPRSSRITPPQTIKWSWCRVN